MIKYLRFSFLVFLASKTVAMADIAVPVFDSQVVQSEVIVVGRFGENPDGSLQFVVDSVLKGAVPQNNRILIDKSSQLAWPFVLGGGPVEPSTHEEFLRRVRQRKWFEEKVIIVGQIEEGRWVSCCYDWSVWLTGESTGEEDHKGLSLDELIGVVEEVVSEQGASSE